MGGRKSPSRPVRPVLFPGFYLRPFHHRSDWGYLCPSAGCWGMWAITGKVPVGLILIWLALGMLGSRNVPCRGNFLSRLNLKGMKGAFVLKDAGLRGYFRVLHLRIFFRLFWPSSPFKKWSSTGSSLSVFALGQCLPIYIASTFTAGGPQSDRKPVLADRRSMVPPRAAGVLIGFLGLYFIVSPFLSK